RHVDSQCTSVAGGRHIVGVGDDGAEFKRAGGGKAAHGQGRTRGTSDAGSIAEIGKRDAIVRGKLPSHGERRGAAVVRDGKGRGGRLADGGGGVVRLRGDRGPRTDGQGRRGTRDRHAIGIRDHHLVFRPRCGQRAAADGQRGRGRAADPRAVAHVTEGVP